MLLQTNSPSEFISWWKAMVGNIYADEELKIKFQEGINEEYFYSGFAIKQYEKISGVVALFNNPFLVYGNLPAACIGKFESIDDFSVMTRLLEAAVKEVKALGKKIIIGPMDGSTWDAYRYPVFSENSIILTEGVYKNYYSRLFQSAGFRPMGKYLTQLDTSLAVNEIKTDKAKKFLAPLNLKFRNIDLVHYTHELKGIFEFCMQSFRNNFLFTPVSEKSFVEKYLKVKPLIDQRYVIIAEHENKIAGIVFCIPEIYLPEKKRIIIKTLAKLPEKKYSGLGTDLTARLYEVAKRNNIEGIFHAFMHQDNASRSISDNFSGEKWREYILFSKPV